MLTDLPGTVPLQNSFHLCGFAFVSLHQQYHTVVASLDSKVLLASKTALAPGRVVVQSQHQSHSLALCSFRGLRVASGYGPEFGLEMMTSAAVFIYGALLGWLFIGPGHTLSSLPQQASPWTNERLDVAVSRKLSCRLGYHAIIPVTALTRNLTWCR